MNVEERKLSNKIYIFEDMLLRSKNPYEIDKIRKELVSMRIKLQQMQFSRVKKRY